MLTQLRLVALIDGWALNSWTSSSTKALLPVPGGPLTYVQPPQSDWRAFVTKHRSALLSDSRPPNFRVALDWVNNCLAAE